MKDEKGRLTSVRRDILKIAIPSMGSSVFNMLYSFADLAWIGRLGKDAVASVTLAMSLYNMNYILNEIFGVSSMVFLSRSWGRKDLKSFESIGRQIVIYKFLAGLLLLVLTYPLSPLFLSWLGSGKIPSSSAVSYYRIMALFLPFSFLMGTMMTTFRSIGDTKTLFYVVAFGSISNMFLDPVFIFTLKMGVSGSALASGICSTASMVLGFLLAKKKWNVWLLRYAKLDLGVLRKILVIGGPSLIDSVNWNVTRVAMVKIFSMYGVLATATFGIFTRTIDTAWMIGFALEGAITTLVGQNLGRRDSSKALEVFSVFISFSQIHLVWLFLHVRYERLLRNTRRRWEDDRYDVHQPFEQLGFQNTSDVHLEGPWFRIQRARPRDSVLDSLWIVGGAFHDQQEKVAEIRGLNRISNPLSFKTVLSEPVLAHDNRVFLAG